MTADQRARAAAAGIRRVHETDLALEWMDDPWDDLAAGEALLLEIERDERPDVVHLNCFVHGAADWRAPALVAGHSCVFSWWGAVHGSAPPAGWDRYRRSVTAGLGGATAVVAPSATMLAALRRWYGPLPVDVGVIPNGSAHAGPRAAAAKQPVVLTAGRAWDAAKNVDTLIRAARRPGLAGRVLVAGEGGRTAPGVRALGSLAAPALAEVRRSAAVYAAPARYEPFGLAILEAARDHCALVLGDIPSLREVWGDAAAYVDPDDEDRLAWTLNRLLDHPAEAARLGERARRRSARFTVASMAGAYHRLYARLVAGTREVAV